MTHRIGIDAGSKTIKLVVVDEDGIPVHSLYHRHRANVLQTLREMIHEVNWRFGAIRGTLHVTGSAGIDDVLYLQSFGCLKGHVHGRGALRDLARRHPSLTITVIDYDPEASALNRENRLRLAVHTERRKKRTG